MTIIESVVAYCRFLSHSFVDSFACSFISFFCVLVIALAGAAAAQVCMVFFFIFGGSIQVHCGAHIHTYTGHFIWYVVFYLKMNKIENAVHMPFRTSQ